MVVDAPVEGIVLGRRIRRAAACLPRLSPPAASPGGRAASSRSAGAARRPPRRPRRGRGPAGRTRMLPATQSLRRTRGHTSRCIGARVRGDVARGRSGGAGAAHGLRRRRSACDDLAWRRAFLQQLEAAPPIERIHERLRRDAPTPLSRTGTMRRRRRTGWRRLRPAHSIHRVRRWTRSCGILEGCLAIGNVDHGEPGRTSRRHSLHGGPTRRRWQPGRAATCNDPALRPGRPTRSPRRRRGQELPSCARQPRRALRRAR